jgi:hypothetical protein
MNAVDRAVARAYGYYGVVRDEALFAWLDPKERRLATELAYASLPSYAPGGTTFERGLHAWEQTIISRPPFPSMGRLLLAAAGGGRELVPLRALGYQVVAFEPALPLVNAARAAVSGDREATVLRGSFEDLPLAVHAGEGPLASLRGTSFDAVVIGWGALSHVLTHPERVALLTSLRALCPKGPVLASFFVDDPERRTASARPSRARTALRSAFRRLGGSGNPPAGVVYGTVGFMHLFLDEEIVRLAHDSGYDIALLAVAPSPHALLVPHNLSGAGTPP